VLLVVRVLVVWCWFCSWASAGEVELHNNDSLKGELFAIHADHILWSTEVIGQIIIPKGSIKAIYSSVPLKVPGVQQACYWLSIENLDALIQCGEQPTMRITFASLHDVVLLDGYANLAHHYEGKLNAVGTSSEGNRSRRDWLVDIDVLVRHFEYRHKVGLKYAAEAVEQDPLKEEYEATYALDWFFSSRTFWFADSSARRDERRDINVRYNVGSGIGYQFWDASKSALSLQTGSEYVYQELDNEAIDPDGFFSWRLAASYRYMFPRGIQFYLNADYLQSMDSGEEWEADLEAGLDLPIAMGITANAKYEYDFDNTPSDGLDKADAVLRFGLGYRW